MTDADFYFARTLVITTPQAGYFQQKLIIFVRNTLEKYEKSIKLPYSGIKMTFILNRLLKSPIFESKFGLFGILKFSVWFKHVFLYDFNKKVSHNHSRNKVALKWPLKNNLTLIPVVRAQQNSFHSKINFFSRVCFSSLSAPSFFQKALHSIKPRQGELLTNQEAAF